MGGNKEATLAQLVEQRFCKAKVPGPNPGGGSSGYIKKLLTGTFWFNKYVL